jgi:CTP:molybdopterin cytidylyltransferase MocA/RimJ/RimL family protein N-acetyltransferase
MIHTDRLIIRKASLDDASFIVSIWNNPVVMIHAGFPEGLNCSVATVKKQIADQNDCSFLNQLLIVSQKETGTLVGQVWMYAPDSSGKSTTDIKLLPDWQGMRYGIELKQALVKHLFEKTDCFFVEATPNVDNIASIRMQESAGAVRVGRGFFKPDSTTTIPITNIEYWIYRIYRNEPPYSDCRKRFFDYSAVVPAAGYSKRMQSFKPLLPWPPNSKDTKYTVIESSVQSLLNAGVSPIVVTVGYRADDILRQLEGWPLICIENTKFSEPMISSIRAALPQIKSQSAVFVLPGDHPSVEPETIRHLISCHEADPGHIHIPVHNKSNGHPTLFPPSSLHRCSVGNLDKGLRSIIHNGEYTVVYHPVDDKGICKNLDYPWDYNI